MKLYVCYGTFPTPRPGGHPCRNAAEALEAAGHKPEIVKSYGLMGMPGAINRSEGRRTAKRLTGSYTVPLLITDDGEAISDSKNIVAWAKANPAT
jgi:hypothetical protein